MSIHRPIWTCGRYNAEKHVALMYNLLAGYSYFFESYSADVIGQVLAVPRNGQVEVEKIASTTGIAEESILAFLETRYFPIHFIHFHLKLSILDTISVSILDN